MQRTLFFLCLSLMGATQMACSPVDSTHVFDQQQAALLLHQGHTTQRTQQMIKLALPNKQQWQRIDLSYGTVGSPIMLIPQNQTREDWHESIRTKISPYAFDNNTNIQKFIDHDIENAKAHCNRVRTDHISIERNTLTYQLSLFGCGDQRNQTQIGKAMTGKDAVYVVYYSAVNGEVAEARIMQMAGVVKSAQLVSQ